MNNSVKKISIRDIGGYRVTLGDSVMQIISDFGCNLNQLILSGQDIIDGNQDYESLIENKLAKSALLIPFPNRVCNGKYEFEGKVYQLNKNLEKEGHAIHGLLFDKKFDLISKTVSNDFVSLSFSYEIKKNELKGYPFNLLTTVSFKLEQKKLTIIVESTNLDNINLPYGVGWHPYIKFGHKIDGCRLIIPSQDILEVDEKKIMIPTGKVVKNPTKLKDDKMGNAVFDTGFTNLKRKETIINNVVVSQDNSMNYLQIYTPEHRQSVAIEPMSCAADAFNNKMGLKVLKPKETVGYNFAIRLK